MFYGDGIPITDISYEYDEFNPAIVGEFSVGRVITLSVYMIWWNNHQYLYYPV